MAALMRSLYHHELATGQLWVAEHGGRLVGYAGLIERGGVAFLADLFVAPTFQSRGIGGALLEAALATPATAYCTMSSGDPRALALYVRAGLRPHWPHLALTTAAPMLARLPGDDVSVAVATPGDAALVAWDARVAGRRRPEDHGYWQGALGAVPVWFRRSGATVGYGYAWRRHGEGAGRSEVRLGPLGVASAADATPCLGALLRWVAQRPDVAGAPRPHDAVTYCVALAGPHPALSALLRAGFRVTGVETFCCSVERLFFDPAAYVALTGPEGTSLF